MIQELSPVKILIMPLIINHSLEYTTLCPENADNFLKLRTNIPSKSQHFYQSAWWIFN